MKRIIKIIGCLYLLSVLFFNCSKPKFEPHPNTYVPPPINWFTPDSLRGREFIFDSLIWANEYDNVLEMNVVYVLTNERHDLFRIPTFPMEVFVKPDGSSAWTSAQNYYHYSTDSYYWYYIDATAGKLKLLYHPFSSQLIGTKASVKVKFL